MAKPDYSVDFKNGNLSPSPNHRWGPMKQGTTSPLNMAESYGDNSGLRLSCFRDPGQGPQTIGSAILPGVTTNSVYVVFKKNALPVESRFVARVEFDSPGTSPFYTPQPPGSAATPPHPPPNPSLTAEPWAVGLGAKFGNENDLGTDTMISATCQFNRRVNADQSIGGVRLNSPESTQATHSTRGGGPPHGPRESENFDFPLNYRKYNLRRSPRLFTLELFYWGDGATQPGNVVIGNASLSVGAKSAQRLFTNGKFAGGTQDWIGAVGVSLVTATGYGQIFVRLRNFSITLVP